MFKPFAGLIVLAAFCQAGPLSTDNLSQAGKSNYYELEPEIVIKPRQLDSADSLRKYFGPGTVSASASTDEKNGKKNVQEDLDLATHISLNNPEFRLVGANQKPIRMRDDMQTKLMVALENLKKDATEFWDSISTKLDKSWSDVSDKVERGWTDMRVNVDKGLTDVNGKLDRSWSDVSSKLDKSWTGLKSVVVDKTKQIVPNGNTSVKDKEPEAN